jgi:hypothetical protein
VVVQVGGQGFVKVVGVGEPAISRIKWFKDGFAAAGEVLFGQCAVTENFNSNLIES